MNDEKFQAAYKNIKKEEIIEELYHKCRANYDLVFENERLKEKNEELRALYESEREVKKDYKSKVNKAIETLGEWTIFETSACTDKIISKTLGILKGVEKE